jgi:hypothetical protein
MTGVHHHSWLFSIAMGAHELPPPWVAWKIDPSDHKEPLAPGFLFLSFFLFFFFFTVLMDFIAVFSYMQSYLFINHIYTWKHQTSNPWGGAMQGLVISRQ